MPRPRRGVTATLSARLVVVAAMGAISVVLLSGGVGASTGHGHFRAPRQAPAAARFRVVSGAEFCEVIEVDGRSCVTDGVGTQYGDNEACEIEVLAATGFLYSAEFDTEPRFDELTVDSVPYSGSVGPDGVAVPADGPMQMSWNSNPWTTGDGWTICWVATAPPTASPTTSSPTVAALAGSTCRRHADCQMVPGSASGVGYCRMPLGKLRRKFALGGGIASTTYARASFFSHIDHRGEAGHAHLLQGLGL